MPGLRERDLLQSKCGIRPAGDPDQRAPRAMISATSTSSRPCEGSLRRLKTDYLDVLLLHRPDPLVEPEEVARAFDELHRAGKVRYFGVSNHTAAQMSSCSAGCDQPLVANQLELSLLHTPADRRGRRDEPR